MKTSRIAALWPTSSGSASAGSSAASFGTSVRARSDLTSNARARCRNARLRVSMHLVEVERLRQVVVGPAAHRLDGGGRAAVGGDRRSPAGRRVPAPARQARRGRRGRASSGLGARRRAGRCSIRARASSPSPASSTLITVGLQRTGRGCGESSGRRRRPGSSRRWSGWCSSWFSVSGQRPRRRGASG